MENSEFAVFLIN